VTVGVPRGKLKRNNLMFCGRREDALYIAGWNASGRCGHVKKCRSWMPGLNRYCPLVVNGRRRGCGRHTILKVSYEVVVGDDIRGVVSE
jgi:hypothetical protein